jgi:hypothetical protein
VDSKIYPVNINKDLNEVVYIIEISKGETAHQALDKRYHKRYGTITNATGQTHTFTCKTFIKYS